MRSVVVALDCMGGECVPAAVLKGAEKALQADDRLRLLLVGDEGRVSEALCSMGDARLLRDRASIVHADGVVSEDAKPAFALRQSRGTSMRMAIEQVSCGRALCVVSAGNTGALMAISMSVLRTLDCLDRPAIVILLPTTNGKHVVMVDVGANVVCTAELLVQFAVMGSAWAKAMHCVAEPSVALLNIGSEEHKGNDVIKEAARLLRMVPMNFMGYIEPNDLLSGKCDVVVCDGLLGNVTLKSMEGAVEFVQGKMRAAFGKSLYGKIVGYLAGHMLKSELDVISMRNRRAGILLGLNGIVVKTHGSSGSDSWAGAIEFAADIVRCDVSGVIANNMSVVRDVLDGASE